MLIKVYATLWLLLLTLVGHSEQQQQCTGSGGCCPYGKLSVQGTQLVGSNGPVQLRGMSLFSSQHPEGAAFFNEQTVKCLKTNWHADIVRAALGVEDNFDKGYISNKAVEMQKELAVINAAINNCMYVLIDWHAHKEYLNDAVDFFRQVSKLCAGKCNCLYETWNEPTSESWSGTIKPYHEKVISAIRENDKDGVVIAGVPKWDQDVDVAAQDQIKGQKNVMYALHFYSATHKEDLRQKAQTALNLNAPLFVSEYGTSPASGNGDIDLAETQKWYDFMDKNKISYINWSIGNKGESSSALQTGTGPNDVCSDSRDTQSGQFVKSMLRKKNPTVPAVCPGGGSSGGGGGNPGQTTTTTTGTTTTTTKPPSGGGGGGSGVVSAVVASVSSWSNGGQFALTFKNTGSKAVCSVTYKVVMPSGETVSSSWNMDAAPNGSQKTPSWVRIPPGGSNSDAGIVVSGGSAPPTVSVDSFSYC